MAVKHAISVVPSRASTARTHSLLTSLAPDVVQHDRLRGVVLENDCPGVLAAGDPGCDRHFSFALPVAVDVQFDHCERVVDGSRPARRFPEVDVAIGDEYDLLAVIGKVGAL